MKSLRRWWRRRRFILAYRILRSEMERHRDAGHNVRFDIVNPSHVHCECRDCPWFTPPFTPPVHWSAPNLDPVTKKYVDGTL
jgi:hypothetical protein